jgi:ferredoxin
MRLHIDTDRCTGSGVCESIAPEVFEVGDDGFVHLLTEDLPADMRDDLQDACDRCPTQALSLEG